MSDTCMSQTLVRDQLLQNVLHKVKGSRNVFLRSTRRETFIQEYTREGGWDSGCTEFLSSCNFFKSPTRVKNRCRKNSKNSAPHFSAMKVFKVLLIFTLNLHLNVKVTKIGKHWRNQTHQKLNDPKRTRKCMTNIAAWHEYNQTFAQGQTSYLATN